MNQLTKQRLGIKEKLWVKAKEIMTVTGWDRKGMERARMYKYVTVDKRTDPATGRVSIYYDLNSLDERLYKQSAQQLTT